METKCICGEISTSAGAVATDGARRAGSSFGCPASGSSFLLSAHRRLQAPTRSQSMKEMQQARARGGASERDASYFLSRRQQWPLQIRGFCMSVATGFVSQSQIFSVTAM